MKILKKFQTILTYITASGLSFVIDLLAFTVILHFLKDHVASAIIIASYLARAISSIFNYVVNKKFVFKYENKKKDNTFWSYFCLVIINITLSGTLVSKLYDLLSINATFIKTCIDALIFVANFFIQKLFIFNNKESDGKLEKYLLPILCFLAIFIKVNKRGISFTYEIYEYIIMLISIVILYLCFLKIFKKENVKALNIMSIIIALCMVIGYSYSLVYSPLYIYKSEIHILVSLLRFFGYYFLIKNVLNTAYYYFVNHKYKLKEGKLCKKLYEHPFLYTFITLAVIYGIYLIFYYPGVINYDNANQIKEVLGLHTRYLDSIVLLNDSVTLTNFNPIIHTLILGNLFKFGLNMGNCNFGLFIYTLIQEIVVISILSYSIYFLKNEGIKPKCLLLVVLAYIIIPFYPFYAMTAVKDTYFYVFTMLYIIKLYQCIKYDYKLIDYIKFLGIMFLLILFRNNGIFLILLSLPFAVFLKHVSWKKTLSLCIIVIAFLVAYNSVLPLFNIPNTSIREVLSIPFQQTARYVKDYPSDVGDDEMEAIDKILTYDTLAKRYVPTLSDKVKNEYNKYATEEDLNNYFKVWSKMFWRHPDAYINATVSNTYGYFYLNDYSWYIYANLNPTLPDDGFDYHFNSLEVGRLILKGYANGFKFVPVAQMLVNCAFYTFAYIYLLILLVIQKKKNLIVLLTPALSLILMCFLGPANTYFRYVLPYAATLPLIVCLVIKEINPTFINKKRN